MTGFVGIDWAPVPLAFFAAILNVYVVAFVSPVTTSVTAVDAYVRGDCAVAPTNGVIT